MKKIKVLVCGGRYYDDYLAVRWTLNLFEIDTLVTGGAPGADKLAELYAKENGIDCAVYPAQWEKYGVAAGPIRNKLMLETETPDLVIAFPGGKGTEDMVAHSLRDCYPVFRVESEK